VESTIRINDGESVVIGGLLSERDTISSRNVPLLSDIPILGYLFRYRSTIKEKIDLVVVITPYVDRPPSTDALDRELERAGFKANVKRLLPATSADAAPREAAAKTGE
jgi:type II secretory pathway component GspD/PulD (secretin)